MANTEIKGGIKITDISKINDADISGQDYTIIVDQETQKTKTITLDKLASFATTGPFGPNYSVLFNTGSQIYGSSNFIWNYDTNKLGINKSDPAYEIDVEGNVRVSGEIIADKVTAREYHTELVSASIIYESGSTKFGDDIGDLHQMTGSLHIYGQNSILNLRTFEPTANTYLTFKNIDSDKGYIGFYETSTENLDGIYEGPPPTVTRDNLDIRNLENGYIRFFTNTAETSLGERAKIGDDKIIFYPQKFQVYDILYTWPAAPVSPSFNNYNGRFLKYTTQTFSNNQVGATLQWADAVTGIYGDPDGEGDLLTGEVNIKPGGGINVATDTVTNSITISATATSANNPTITMSAGTGLTGGSTFTLNQASNQTITFDLDFSELTDMTGDITSTTEFILQDGTTESRKAASEIKLSVFNNNSGWTSNTGTVTSIATNNGITGGPITGTGTLGLTGQALALHNLNANGLITRTGSGAVATRTITAGSGITVSNGNGVNGDPSIANSGVISLTNGTNTTVSNIGNGVWQVNSTATGGVTQTSGTSTFIPVFDEDPQSQTSVDTMDPNVGAMTWRRIGDIVTLEIQANVSSVSSSVSDPSFLTLSPLSLSTNAPPPPLKFFNPIGNVQTNLPTTVTSPGAPSDVRAIWIGRDIHLYHKTSSGLYQFQNLFLREADKYYYISLNLTYIAGTTVFDAINVSTLETYMNSNVGSVTAIEPQDF